MRAQQRAVVASLDRGELGHPRLDAVGDPVQDFALVPWAWSRAQPSKASRAAATAARGFGRSAARDLGDAASRRSARRPRTARPSPRAPRRSSDRSRPRRPRRPCARPWRPLPRPRRSFGYERYGRSRTPVKPPRSRGPRAAADVVRYPAMGLLSPGEQPLDVTRFDVEIGQRRSSHPTSAARPSSSWSRGAFGVPGRLDAQARAPPAHRVVQAARRVQPDAHRRDRRAAGCSPPRAGTSGWPSPTRRARSGIRLRSSSRRPRPPMKIERIRSLRRDGARGRRATTPRRTRPARSAPSRRAPRSCTRTTSRPSSPVRGRSRSELVGAGAGARHRARRGRRRRADRRHRGVVRRATSG